MATAVLQKSYPRTFTPGNILECELYFESDHQEKAFKKKLSNLIKKHMEIRIPEDRMRACKKLMEIVEMLATAETELPFKPEDQIVINTEGCRKGGEWFVGAIGQYVMSLPSDYWLVRNGRYDKQLESKI
jgi:hypothetical protein